MKKMLTITPHCYDAGASDDEYGYVEDERYLSLSTFPPAVQAHILERYANGFVENLREGERHGCLLSQWLDLDTVSPNPETGTVSCRLSDAGKNQTRATVLKEIDREGEGWLTCVAELYDVPGYSMLLLGETVEITSLNPHTTAPEGSCCTEG